MTAAASDTSGRKPPTPIEHEWDQDEQENCEPDRDGRTREDDGAVTVAIVRTIASFFDPPLPSSSRKR